MTPVRAQDVDLTQPQPDDLLPTQRLRDELRARKGNRRALARALAGPEADEKTIERWRRAIYHYLGRTRAIPEDDTAEAMAAALGRDRDYFKVTRPTTTLEEINRKVDEVIAAVAPARARIDESSGGREEVLEPLRDIRDAAEAIERASLEIQRAVATLADLAASPAPAEGIRGRTPSGRRLGRSDEPRHRSAPRPPTKR